MKTILFVIVLMLVGGALCFAQEPQSLFAYSDSTVGWTVAGVQSAGSVGQTFGSVGGSVGGQSFGSVGSSVTRSRTVTRTGPAFQPLRRIVRPFRFRQATWTRQAAFASSSVASHLINDHGIPADQVASMTPGQQEALHNQLHGG